MAFTSTTATAKAVADIKEIHFLKHTNGEPAASTALADTNWFSVATIRGSVNVSQDAVSTEKINIDQSNMPIGITTEPGDFTFEATLASLAANDLGKWFTKANSQTTFTAVGRDFTGYGYDIEGELVECCVLVVTRTNDAFFFPNCKVSAAINKDDKVFGVNISGMVLGHTAEGNNDVYVFSSVAHEG